MSDTIRMTFENVEWPSREEWAQWRRELHKWPEVSSEATNYMTEEERLLLVDAMRQRWREIGREMRAASEKSERERCRDSRQAINRGIKKLKAGKLPFLLFYHQGAEDLLRPYIEKREAALAQAVKAAKEEAAQTPIDDAAWEEELAWRRKLTS